MFLRNCWYAAGWGIDFNQPGPLTRTIIDEPLVFYRKTDGQLVAFEDRCCHRLAPLSAGRVEGDDLRCMYHGLRFNCSGKCVEIPGQPVIPPQTKVRAYPVVERHSVVWVWMGEAQKADEGLIPPFKGIDDPEFPMLPGRMDYNANYMLINDNLLDLSHLAYVHANSFGAGSEFATKRPKITRVERGLRVSRWVEQPTPKYLSTQITIDRVDTWLSYDFLVPGVFLLDVGFYPAGAAQEANNAAPTREPMYAEYTSQAITPLTQRTSSYLFCFGSWARSPNKQYYRDVAEVVFNEDKVMVEAQQKVLDRSPGVKMSPTSFDAAPSQFRLLLEKFIKQEDLERVSATPERGEAVLNP